MRILGISGSLRTASSNSAALRAMALLAPPFVDFVLYDGLASLPHFNPDLDRAEAFQRPPCEVCALRKSIGQSDGVVIASPEYAHGVPGSLKNALDWLVGSVEFPGKPVTVINTSPRAIHADAQLREILITMSAKLIEMGPIAVPYDAKEIEFDLTLSEKLRAALSDLIEAMQDPDHA